MMSCEPRQIGFVTCVSDALLKSVRFLDVRLMKSFFVQTCELIDFYEDAAGP